MTNEIEHLNLIVSLGVTPAFAGVDWTNFNGPDLNNISLETGLLRNWPAGGPRLLFKYDKCGKGYSGVSIADAMIFTAGDFNDDSKVIALDMDGKLVWEANCGNAWKGDWPGSRCTPTYNDGCVYYMNGNGEINCLDAKSGENKWKFNVVDKLKGRKGHWGYAESLIVDGNNLIVLPGAADCLLIALDKKTGNVVWSTPNPSNEAAAYCSPTIIEHDNTRQIVTLSQKSLISVNAKTGELLWSAPHPTMHDMNTVTPVFFDGLVFVTSIDTGCECFQMTKEKNELQSIWKTKSMDVHHGGVISLNGCVYGFGTKTKGLFCLDLKTGKEMWNDAGVEKGTLTCADGMLFVLAEKGGKVCLAEASPSKYNLLSSFQVKDESKDFFWAHPVVSGGKFYVRHDNMLYVFDIKQ